MKLDEFKKAMSPDEEIKKAIDSVSRMMSLYQKRDVFDAAKLAPCSAISKIYYLFSEYDRHATEYEDSEQYTYMYIMRLYRLIVEAYEELREEYSNA